MRCGHGGMMSRNAMVVVSMGWGVPFWGDNRNDNRSPSGGSARAELPGMRLARVGWWDHGGRFPAFGRLSVGCGWDWFDSWGGGGGEDADGEEGTGGGGFACGVLVDNGLAVVVV